MSLFRRLLPFWLLLFLTGCGKSTADWVEQAKSADPVKRLHAIHALREKVDEKEVVLPVLIEALKDENTSVRRDAARSLGHFGSEAREAAPALRMLLPDKEPSVRKAAGEALKQIDSTAAARATVGSN
jgi:HEAT repeat protein